eukprot:NODE_4058_length_1121_cov_134.299599_g3864_i0.p1 GENE.NODE_4058_length_1121_cov_134.299599_g3864_i0~~NODE_4058_length_1121_cov_134.299599_g3864_i0.p1  ORF type:complete len:321 (-),score=89.35 NODE_4058_length_1121_cov_134.299599_g3864_i0:82-1044(-)
MSADKIFSEGQWYHEELEAGLVYSYKINKTLFQGDSDFQKVEVFDTVPFGRLLVTDGLAQSSQVDEHVYHELLVHPAMVAHGAPKKVYIGGGGEGATLRECLKYESVEEVVMVDIDAYVVDKCKEHLPGHGNWEDKRGKVIIDDAKAVLEKTPDGTYDVIVLDLSDPLDGGPCYQLYTTEFYTMCKNKLTENGVLVTQSGCASIREVSVQSGVFSPIHCTLKQVFPQVEGFSVYVPAFANEWGYNLACKNPNGKTKDLDINARLASMKVADKMQYYDQGAHTRAFSLSKPVSAALENEKRVMNVANPLFMTASHTGIAKK